MQLDTCSRVLRSPLMHLLENNTTDQVNSCIRRQPKRVYLCFSPHHAAEAPAKKKRTLFLSISAQAKANYRNRLFALARTAWPACPARRRRSSSCLTPRTARPARPTSAAKKVRGRHSATCRPLLPRASTVRRVLLVRLKRQWRGANTIVAHRSALSICAAAT